MVKNMEVSLLLYKLCYFICLSMILIFIIIISVNDKDTEKGYSPKHVADETLLAVLRDNKEKTIATFLPKIAEFLRYMIPTLYFIIMNIRAKKITKKE